MNAATFLTRLTAVLCTLLLMYVPVAPSETAQQQQTSAPEQQQPPATKIPNDQLDSLVAPIALYPDPMLAQVLAASTYPLEIMQLQQWLGKNKGIKDKALADAVATALGPQRSSFGRITGCCEAPCRQYSVDHRLGQRLPRATKRCHGRCATYAHEGQGQRQSEIE